MMMHAGEPSLQPSALGRTPPIAVVGVSALFPGAPDTAAFWRDILEGADRLSELPRTRWVGGDYFDPRPGTPDKVYTTRGGFLSPVEFSPLEFGLPPNVLAATDTAQLLALVVAKRALLEATRGRFESMDRSRISVVLGVASATELVGQMVGRIQIPVAERAMRAAGFDEAEVARVRALLESWYVPWQESTFPGLLGNVVAGRVANRLDLGGTNIVVDAACASSLAAIDTAINELALGRSDLVLSGGVDTLNDVLMFMCFSQTGALSRSGDCRPFSDDADGTMLGEGVGILALKRLSDAERDGDAIYAVIQGVGTSSDGRAKSIYAPAPEGQALALRRAYERAGYGADTVGLVEGHGTATQAGDAAEVEALKAVFRSAGAREQSCALGSVKAQIGHTKAAAGSAGLIKVVMALHHKVLPPTCKVRAPNQSLRALDSPFYLNTELRPWISARAQPRRASVSALGFGGTNFHVAVEEYRGPARPARLRAQPSELFLLSGESALEIAERCRREAERLTGLAREARVHFAKRSQAAFDPRANARLAIVAAPTEELEEKLRLAADALAKGEAAFFSLPRGIHYRSGTAFDTVAFLFPGQGSQYVGMSRDLAVHFDCVRSVWDRSAELLADSALSLAEVVFPAPLPGDAAKQAREQRLTATEWAQPAIAATSLAMLSILERVKLRPACAAGHSLGEVTALGAFGAFGAFEPATTVRLARRRGELVASAATTPGAMLAVARDRQSLEAWLAENPLDVVIANHNAPDQVVLSGPSAAIAEAERRLRAEQIDHRRLPVSTAFHSPLVEGACAPFREFLESVAVGPPQVPVYSNRTGAVYPSEAPAIREEVARALAEPVRFVEQIESMYAAGVRAFVEVGPGSVLTKLVARCLGERPHVAVALDAPGKHGVTALWDALGRLSVAGVRLALEGLWDGDALPEDPALVSASKLSVSLAGENFGKPVLPDVEPRAVGVRARAPEVERPAEVAEPRDVPSAPADASVFAVQMEYQRLMAESHMAFLRAVSASRSGSGSGEEEVLELPRAHARVHAPAPLLPQEPANEPRQAPVTRVTSERAPPAPVDLAGLVRQVVAEKTGYPEEMIEPGMDLEADLGIDSIKRVEILSEVRTRAPGLPEIDSGRMIRTRTLAEIIAYLAGQTARQDVPLPASESAQVAENGHASSGVGRFATRAIPSQPSGLALAGLFGAGTVAVTSDGGGVAEALVKRLLERGISAALVDVVPLDARVVLFLGGLRRVEDFEQAQAINYDAFRLARSIAARFREDGGAFVTVQDTGGDFGLSGRSGTRAWLAGLGALAKTAAREWPKASVRALDVERGARGDEAIAGVILEELLQGGPEVEVGLRADGQRVAICTVSAPELEPAPEIPEGAVFVASGGARGVTAAALIALAGQVRPRLLLLGRSPLQEEPPEFHGTHGDAELKKLALEEAKRKNLPVAPKEIAQRVRALVASREVRETLERLEHAGACVRYAAVDARDAPALERVLSEVRGTWGPIQGVIHGAGVLSDALLEHKTDAQFADVWTTKVLGLRALLEVTEQDPVRWVVLFSSVAARLGNAGQADYAMANEVLNKVAASVALRCGDSCRVVSIGWGPWDGGMVTPLLRGHFEARGVGLLSPEAGASAFVRELTGRGSVEIGIGADRELRLGPTGKLEADVLVNESRWPQLASHRIQGHVVLPVALVVEWFARLVQPLTRGRRSFEIRDLGVVRGVPLAGYFTDAGDRLRLSAEPASDGATVALELRDAGGGLRYSGALDLRPASLASPPATLGALERSPWQSTEFYGPSALFHGAHFQVLRDIDGISDRHARGVVSGVSEVGWNGFYHCDPAALDGAFQLALLFGLHKGLGQSLPMHVERVIRYAGASPGPYRCELTERRRTREVLACDLRLYAEDGEPALDLLGVELFVVPRGTSAS